MAFNEDQANPVNAFENDSLDEYSQIANDMDKQKADSLKEIVTQSKKKDPKSFKDTYNLAKETSLPVDAVERNIDKIKRSKEADIDYSDLVKTHPGLSKWLGKSENAMLGHDEFESLKKVDQYSSRIKVNKKERGLIEATARSSESGAHALGSNSALLLAAYGMVDPETASQYIAGSQLKQREIKEGQPTFVKEFEAEMQSDVEDIDKRFTQFRGSYEEAKKGNISKALKDFGAGGAMTVLESLDLLGSAITSPRGLVAASAESLSSSAPSLVTGFAGSKAGAAAGAAAGSAIPGAGTAAGAAIGGAVGFGVGSFAGSIPVEIGASIAEDLSERGVDLTNPTQVQKALSDKKFLNEILERAERKGVTTAAVEGLFNMFAGKFLAGAKGAKGAAKAAGSLSKGQKALGKIKSAVPKLKAGALDVGVDATGEFIGELGGSIAKEKGDLSKVSVGQSFLEGTVSLGKSVGDVAVGALNWSRESYSQDTSNAAEEIFNDAQNALESIKEVESLENLVAAASEAETTKEGVGALHTLVNESGSQDSSVFFQADDWDSYWESKGESGLRKAYEISDEVGKSYAEASATGADIEINTGLFVESAAKDESVAALTTKAKTRVDGLTLDSANEMVKNLPSMLKTLSDEASLAEDTEFQDAKAEVKSRVKDQLILAGKSQTEADSLATLYAERQQVRAVNRGQDPLTVFKEMNLEIRKEGQQTIRENTTYDQVLKAKQLRKQRRDEAIEKVRAEKAQARVDKKKNKEQDKAKKAEKKESDAIIEAAEKAVIGDQPMEIEELTGEALTMANEFIDSELEQMIYEIDQSEKGQRSGFEIVVPDKHGGGEKVNISTSTKSTYPTWYSEAKVKNPKHLKEVVKSRKGPVFERLRTIAAERLINGYENQHSGQMEPDDSFRSLLGMESIFDDASGQEFFQSAYHGTPHEFEKFQLSEIGTGEGAQAYGWGLYFAEDKAIANWYRKKLSEGSLEQGIEINGYSNEDIERLYDVVSGSLVRHIEDYKMSGDHDLFLKSIDNIVRVLEEDFGRNSPGSPMYENAKPKMKEAMDKRRPDTKRKIELVESLRDIDIDSVNITGQGQLYKVEVPEKNQMLDWDKAIIDQDPSVIEALYNNGLIPYNMDRREAEEIVAKAEKEDAEYDMDSFDWFKKPSDQELEEINKRQFARYAVTGHGSLTYSKMQKDLVDMINSDKGGSKEYKRLVAEMKRVKTATSMSNTGESLYRQLASDAEMGAYRELTEYKKELKKSGHETGARGELVKTLSPEELSKLEDLEERSRTGDRLASLQLLDMGIPALKYLDAGSRDATNKTQNFVVFDETLINIEDTYFQENFRKENGWLLKDNEKLQKFVEMPKRSKIVKVATPVKKPGSYVQAAINFKNKNRSNINTKGVTNKHIQKNVILTDEFFDTQSQSIFQTHSQLRKRDNSPNKKKSKVMHELSLAALNNMPAILRDMTFVSSTSDTTSVYYAPIRNAQQNGLVRVEVNRELVNGELRNVASKIEIVADVQDAAQTSVTSKKLQDKSGRVPELRSDMSIAELQTRVNARRQSNFFQGEKQDPKGKITVGKNFLRIDLLAKADPSTFIHETGHLWLEEMKQDLKFIQDAKGERTDAQAKFLEDVETIKEYLGVDSLDNVETEHHELWARSIEKYLMEGKAPTAKLQKIFSKFKVWLTSVYRNLMNINATLTDDVRGVMDRMVATEDEINAAKRDMGIKSILNKDLTDKVNKKKLKDYEELRELFDEDAKEKMSSELIKQWKREKELFRSGEFKTLKKDAEEYLKKQRPYKAFDMIKNAKDPSGKPVKMDRDRLVSLFGEDVLKLFPKYFYSAKDGIDPNTIANIAEYESIDEMVDEFKGLVPIKKQAAAMAEEKLKERYQDLFVDDEKLGDLADKFVHSDKRSEVLLLELSMLSDAQKEIVTEGVRKTARKIPTNKEVIREASAILGSKKVGSIRPYLFKNAEIREARKVEEFIGKSDYDSAFTAKQNELLNHELYKQAREAKKMQEKSLKAYKNLSKADAKLSKTRDLSFINAARMILSDYGLSIDPTEAQSKMDRIQDYDPEVYETVMGIIESVRIEPRPYKELSQDEFQELRDVFDALWELSRSSRQIEIDGVKRDVSDISDELIELLEPFTKQKPKEKYQRAKTKWELTYEGLLSLKSKFRRVEHWVEVMDKGNIDGLFRKVMFQNVSDATDRYFEKRKEYNERLVNMSKEIQVDDVEIVSDELGYKFKDKSEILGALLHIGNDSNLKKLLIGRGWGSLNEDGSMNTSKWDAFISRMYKEKIITKKDMDYIQNVWDLMAEIKPMAQKAHKQVYGFFFDEVTTNEFETPFGTYKGGYAPAVVDHTLVKDAQRREELKEFTENNPSYALPGSGGNGFTKNRNSNYNKPLNLNINLVSKHIDDVVRFSIVKPEVVNAAKIITNPEFRDAMDQVDPTVIDGMLKPSLQRADKNRKSDVNPDSPVLIKKGASYLQKTMSANIMFMNVVNTVEQFTGFLAAATKIKPRSLFEGAMLYMRNYKEISKSIDEKSTFMRTHTDDTIFEIQKNSQDLFSNKSKFDKVREFTDKNAYILQMVTQEFIDKTIWISAYNEGISEGLTEKQSVTKADSVIRTTQNANRPQDIAAFQSAGWLNVIQMFMGYFNMVANMNATNFSKLYYEDIGMKEKFQRGLYLYTAGYASLAILSAALRKAAAGGLDEDEDGEYLDDLHQVFVSSQFEFGMAMIPLLGQAVNAGVNRGDGKFYNDKMSASPVFEALSVTTDYVTPDFISGGESFKKANVRDGLTALGIITGLPLRPIAKPITYIKDVESGEASPTGPIDFTRGIITGKKGMKNN